MVVEAAVVPGTVGVDELELGDPVEGAVQRRGVRLQRAEHGLPAVEHVRADSVVTEGLQPVDLVVLARQVEQPPLHLGRRHPLARGEVERGAQRQVVRDGVHRLDGTGEHECVRAQGVVLDEEQHDRRHADLEERRDLGEVGVAGDHVEPAVSLPRWRAARRGC